MKKWIVKVLIVAVFIMMLPSQNLFAQQKVVAVGSEILELTDQMKKEIIDSIAVLMIKNYVYPEIGKQIANHLTKQLKNKKYKEFRDIMELKQYTRSV